MLPERKPRRKSGAWIVWPFLLAAIGAGAWSAGWYWMAGQVETRMDAAAAQVKAGGAELSWKQRTVSGFPFRLDVTLQGVRAADPSGWAVEAPVLKGEAYAYAPNHWVLLAPDGVVFNRPDTGDKDPGGKVVVKGEALRASVVADPGASLPRITVEGAKLTFSTPGAAQTFWMQGVEKLSFRLNPGPGDQGALLLRLDGAQARLTGLVARIAQDRPVQLNWESTFTKASALKGADWPAMARAWSAAGGSITVGSNTNILAGEALFDVREGQLSVDRNGNLTGSLDTELKQAPRALAAMGAAGEIDPATATVAAVAAAGQQDENQVMPAQIVFRDGKTWLGPLPLTDAPRLW